MINNLNWNQAIFFFDVDDTLIDTASNSITASEGVLHVISQHIHKDKSNLITQRFNRIFLTLMQGHMAKNEDDWQKIEGGKQYHDSIIKRIEYLQKPIVEKYETVKKWSREVILKIAVEDFDSTLAPDILYQAIDGYWNSISNNSHPMKGVLELFHEIKNHNRPIYLITSSDARLQLNSDGLFVYDPPYSENFKMNRMESLRSKGLNFNKASIGDPEDKPHMDFFEKGINIANNDLGHSIDTHNVIMFGDSYAGDLQTPREKLNFGLAVLFRKGQQEMKEEAERYISTGNISLITHYLS